MTTGSRSLLFGVALVLSPLVVQAADPPAAKKESSRVQYARTYVDLARLELQIAKDRNKAVARTLPPALIVMLEEQVALSEEWLAQAESVAAGKPYNTAVKTAEILVKMADFNYARAAEANKLSPMPPHALERLKLKADLARLNLASAKELDPSSSEAQTNFQLDRLRENVLEMRIRQVELLDRN